jgi:hypothetical protein
VITSGWFLGMRSCLPRGVEALLDPGTAIGQGYADEEIDECDGAIDL